MQTACSKREVADALPKILSNQKQRHLSSENLALIFCSLKKNITQECQWLEIVYTLLYKVPCLITNSVSKQTKLSII